MRSSTIFFLSFAHARILHYKHWLSGKVNISLMVEDVPAFVREVIMCLTHCRLLRAPIHDDSARTRQIALLDIKDGAASSINFKRCSFREPMQPRKICAIPEFSFFSLRNLLRFCFHVVYFIALTFYYSLQNERGIAVDSRFLVFYLWATYLV